MWILVPTTILFMLYVEFSPTMGRIWYRYDSEGNGYFTFKGLFDLMLYPLLNYRMWIPKLWDINFFIWIFGAVAINKFYIHCFTQE